MPIPSIFTEKLHGNKGWFALFENNWTVVPLTMVGNTNVVYWTLCCILVHFWMHMQMQQAVFNLNNGSFR